MGVPSRRYEPPVSFEDFNRELIKDLRAHGGKATSGPFQGRDVLILTTKGAKSGQLRENPLAYTRDGDNLVVVGSKGGGPSHPAWFHNLVTHPEVMVEAGGESFEARAHVPQGGAFTSSTPTSSRPFTSTEGGPRARSRSSSWSASNPASRMTAPAAEKKLP